MVRPGRELLSGQVEVDETMLGGVTHGRGGGRGRKIPIGVAVEIRGTGMGRVRLVQLPNTYKETLEAFVRKTVAPGTKVLSDGSWGYGEIYRFGYRHEGVVLEGRGRQAAVAVLPRVHRVASLFKRWVLGTHQGRVSSKQLEGYLEEFSFRYNRRSSSSRGQLFYRLAQQAVCLKPTTYESLVKS